jgi:hypothetical protein
VPARSGSLDELQGETLHPPVDADVTDSDSALGQQLLNIAVGQSVPRYQRTTTEITSGGNRKPANTEVTR